jgi:hypothetical protein
MDLDPDMVGDQPDDPLAVGGLSDRSAGRRPTSKRSIHTAPSGLSMTSATPGSSSRASSKGPKAVRSMRWLRDISGSDLEGSTAHPRC